MYSRGLYILAVLVCSAFAAPSAFLSSLNPRTRACANSPKTIAGTLLPPRTPTPVHPLPRGGSESSGDMWCAPGTQTYINVIMNTIIPASPLQRLLGEAFAAILSHLQAHGDGLVPSGVFSWFGPDVDGHVGCALHVWNAANHQITWAVLGAALRALWDYMYANNRYGAADFEVYDGNNEVALGVIGASPAGP